MTWSRGMSQMSRILIWSYRLKDLTNSYVLHCFWTSQNCSYLCNQMSHWDGVWKFSILNSKVIFLKSKLNTAKIWLILLDHVTFFNWLEYCASWFTRLLYSKNIQCGPPWGEYANEVLNMFINNNRTCG